MTKEEIHEVQDLFAAAAKRVQLAGFDAVEIQFCPRYLLPISIPHHQYQD